MTGHGPHSSQLGDNFYDVNSSLILVWPLWARIPESLPTKVAKCVVLCIVRVYMFTVLYCTVLYCTELYCTVLYWTVLYCIVLYCIVLNCTVLYCTELYCTVLYWTVLYCIVLNCTVQLPPFVKPIAVNKYIISYQCASIFRLYVNCQSCQTWYVIGSVIWWTNTLLNIFVWDLPRRGQIEICGLFGEIYILPWISLQQVPPKR